MMVENKTIPANSELSEGKRVLLEKRLRSAVQGARKRANIPPRLDRSKAPLSFAQQQLWFLDQLAPGSALYNISTAVRLRGRLDRQALERALAVIVSRQEPLRTRFVAVEGSPSQVIDEPGQAKTQLPILDLSTLPAESRLAEAQRRLRQEAQRPFDLAHDLMLRTALLRLDDTDHVLSITAHHIAADGWSLGVFFRELEAAYDAFSRGHAPSLPELPVQYADFAAWQQEKMRGELHEAQLAYWTRQLSGAPALLELPADRPRPPVQSFRGACEAVTLPAGLSVRLKALARQEEATLFMLLLAAFKALLYRYTRQTDILVGTPVAGRNQVETEALIGYFINTLALRTSLDGDPEFRDLLQRVRKVTLDALAHQDVSFEQVVDELRLERSLGHNPLFQVMFVLQSAPMRPSGLAGLALEIMDVDTETAKFDLTLAIEERENGLQAALEYRTDLFERHSIQRMLGHFQTLLEGVAANPSKRISRLPILTRSEREQLLIEWNDTRTNYPREKTIPQLFEEQAGLTPEAVAVSFEGEELTYRQLNERANQLAGYLRTLGVGPNVLVAVCMERSLEMIVALLGILKAGGAYVSLDPTYPKARLAFMLEDTRARVILTQERLRRALPGFWEGASSDPKIENRKSKIENPILVCLDTGWEGIARESLAAPVGPGLAGAENLAYVSYTSGSTGRPKGVCVPHRGVVRLVKDTNYARFGPDEVFVQLAPISFDASTLEIWGALLNGARLEVFPPITPSLAELGEFIQKRRITTLWLTAGLFHQMVEENLDGLRNVRQLLAGGDVLSVPHVQKALERLSGCQLINGYGPTENTTFTCCHRIIEPCSDGRTIPIGRPIANTEVYVLDDLLQPVPIGVPGELCTGGDGLARGYLNRPELTAEKFVANPFQSRAGVPPAPTGERLYRTGDMARWRPDGTIEFLGRMDLQVKIRGFRVELGEIETILSRHPDVRECVVAAPAAVRGERQLAAYIVAHDYRSSRQEETQTRLTDSTPSPGGVSSLGAPASSPASAPQQPHAGAHRLDTGDLRSFLQEKLPAYMVPSSFVLLKSLPLNANGKVDRRALPLPDQQAPEPGKKFLAPRDAVELQLKQVWESVLGIQPIGVEDRFFELGGHSLLAVRLVARIERVFGKKLPVAAVFQSPSIAQLATILRERGQRRPDSAVVEIQPNGARPPLFLIHGAGGGMLWGYTNLSRHLGPEQPIFAFNSRGLNGQTEFTSLQEMAAKYVADLIAFQPHGPYYLGGYCFGGDVAYEMARQLEAKGEKVALLALMNCAPPNSSFAQVRWTPLFLLKFARNLCVVAAAGFQGTAEQRRVFLRWAGENLKRTMIRLFNGRFGRGRDPDAEKLVEEVEASLDLPPNVRGLWRIHLRALIDYHPQPYAGRVTLFRSRGHPLLCSFDPQYGWGDLAAGGAVVKIVPGAHESILEEPHVRVVAEELNRSLREAL
jgi:amino acid adenylation domain-containing protein